MPREARGGIGELDAQGVREVDFAATRCDLGAVAFGDEPDLEAQGITGAGREERGPVVVAFATTDHNLAAIDVDILHTEGERLHEAEATAVEKLANQAKGRSEVVEERHGVTAGEDRRDVVRATRALEAVERRHGQLEDAAIEEDDGAECLVHGGGGDVTLDREVVEKRDDLRSPHLTRVTAAVEANEGADPVEIGFLGARGVVEATEGAVYGFNQGHRRALLGFVTSIGHGAEGVA